MGHRDNEEFKQQLVHAGLVGCERPKSVTVVPVDRFCVEKQGVLTFLVIAAGF